MKPHPRIRKTTKWSGAAVTLLLVVAWIGSGWRYVSWVGRNGSGMDVVAGQVVVGYLPRTIPSRDAGVAVLHRTPMPFRWGYSESMGPGMWIVGVPLWPAAALSLFVTSAAWRLDTLAHRRAKLNLCPNCHYDRTGLPTTAICPECGKGAA